MIVADTSYLVEAILRNAKLLDDEVIVAPDLALYEILNTIWKHETLIGDLQNPSLHVELVLELISAETVLLVRPDERLVNDAYALSVKYRTPVYDTVFVALALQLGLELRTFDDKQTKILSKERLE